MAIVYQHKRKDNGEVFYVGIGKSIHRAYEKRNRSSHWHGLVEKYGYLVDITHTDIIWEEACAIEKCPHCDKIGSVSMMKRWHFHNCKNY